MFRKSSCDRPGHRRRPCRRPSPVATYFCLERFGPRDPRQAKPIAPELVTAIRNADAEVVRNLIGTARK